MFIKSLFINFILILVYFNIAYAETQDSIIYADFLSADEYKNVTAEGNVKIITNGEIISSENIYIDEENDLIIIDDEFTYKDNRGNYYFGSRGEFTKDLNNGLIYDFGFLGSDKTRIKGTTARKKGNVDIIDKSVITTCRTIKLFNCPVWQMKSSKLIHDKDLLFVYQKNMFLEVLNFPIFYTPFHAAPSPLRKERKSGFLTPEFIPWNSIHGGSLRTPYYFNISENKELTINPEFFYTQNRQHIKYNYAQKNTSGKFNLSASSVTDLDNSGDFQWLEDASLSIDTKNNINEHFTAGLDLNLQTRGSYLREYDPSNPVNLLTSLGTTAYIDGYSLISNDDILITEAYNFQAVKETDSSKKIPVVAPYISYNSGNKVFFDKANLQNNFIFYNIFRDKNTEDHAYRQTRLNYDANISYQNLFIGHSKLKLETTIQTDAYSTYKKQIGDEYVSNEHFRIFPMSGAFLEIPYINKSNYIYTPSLFLVMNGSNNNTNEISNELTTDNEFDMPRFYSLNRFSGNDKFDNGQRVGYALDISKNNFNFNIAQGYQISNYSDYNKNINMEKDFSDVLGGLSLSNLFNETTNFDYNYRYNPYEKYVYYQESGINTETDHGIYSIGYFNADKRSSSLPFDDRESLSFGFASNTIMEYSKFSVSQNFNLIENSVDTSSINYIYDDECFTLQTQYNRRFFSNTPDTFSFTMLFKFFEKEHYVPQFIIDDYIYTPLNKGGLDTY
tara:strand:- start:2193 stop:4382 length:2190 start_codon:yes stop_codon:yes gene_type:complete